MNPFHVFVNPRYSVYALRREALRVWRRFPRNDKKQRLIVFDPSLQAFSGHHMEFAQIIKEECQTKFDVRFYANFEADTKVLLTLPAAPICHYGIYPPSESEFEKVNGVLTASTADALARIDKSDTDSEALLILHTATVFQLGGLAKWYLALPKSRRPKLCIQFQFPLEFRLRNDAATREKAIGLARSSAKNLAATGKARFAANSTSLARRVSKQLDVECAVFPLPVRWPDLSDEMLPESGAIFGFFGGLRSEKGALLIRKAIPEFAAHYPDSRFLIHAPPAESESTIINELEKLHQVELIQRNFQSKAEYFKHFSRASCILLPYDPNEYAYRTSSILIESLGLGRMVVTTRGSWLSTEAGRRGANVIDMTSFTSDALLAALQSARIKLKVQPIKWEIDREIIRENSPAAFCSALVNIARDGLGCVHHGC
jgi:glycosyltransferase involved in cell wall biosynthesis